MDENGHRVSFAAWAFKQLSDRDRPSGVYGAKSKNKKHNSQAIEQRNYHLRGPAEAKHDGIKKVAVGFEPGEHNSMYRHYNFVADGEVLDVDEIACRRVPCSCKQGCVPQRKKRTKEERYGPTTSCVLAPIMQKSDGTSYNDYT